MKNELPAGSRPSILNCARSKKALNMFLSWQDPANDSGHQNDRTGKYFPIPLKQPDPSKQRLLVWFWQETGLIQ